MSEPAPETPAVEPAAPAEPAWSGPSQDEWEQTQEQLAQYSQLAQQQQFQQFQQPVPQYQGPNVPDPLSETWGQDFERYVDERLQFVANLEREMQQAQGQEDAMARFDQMQGEGSFNADMAWTVARQIAAAQPPRNDADANRILTEAAAQVRAYERQIGEAYHQQQLEQLQGVAGAPRQVPAGQPGAQTVPVGGYGNVPNAVTSRMFGRRW
jgi:hypothetical protein